MTTSAAEISGRPGRILVVDDERDNRELLDVILSWEGFAVSTASDGEAALAAAASHAPHLILLDVMMPGMSGYDVTRRLKKDAATKHIPIILVTALAGPDARAQGVSAGADGFLAKPLDREGLVLAVRAVFETTYAGGYRA
jgi:two-component system cell cycle response regulator